jgi:hypothetical protein
MKKTYLSPRTDVEHVLLEHNFTASPWYKKGGQGDFDYDVEDPDEDGWG